MERRGSFENKALKVWPISAQISPFPADTLPPWLWLVASQHHMPPRSQRVVQVFVISPSFPNPILSSNSQPHNDHGISTVEERHVAHHRILCYVLSASYMLSQDYSHLAITLVPAENGSQTKTAAQGIMLNLLFKCIIFQSNSHQLSLPIMQSNMVSHSHLITGRFEAQLGIQTVLHLSSLEVTEAPLAVSFFLRLGFMVQPRLPPNSQASLGRPHIFSTSCLSLLIIAVDYHVRLFSQLKSQLCIHGV